MNRHRPAGQRSAGFAWVALAVALATGPAALLVQADDRFAALAMRIERNVTDQDHEVVIEVKSGDIGLSALKLVAPDGRTLLDLKAADSRLGLRTLTLETPEPRDLARLLADYPAGRYVFTGTTTAGRALAGVVVLDHQLPEPARWQFPAAGAPGVALRGLVLRWDVGKGTHSQTLSIEVEKTGQKVVQTAMPATARQWRVPDGALGAGKAYKLALGGIGPGGNASYIETSFTTRRP